MRRLSEFNNASFRRGAPKLKEGLWWLVRSFLFATSFPLPSSWKVAALRVFGAEVGEGVVIRSRVNITFPWKLKVGDDVWIGDEVMILSLAEVRIASNVCLSQRAFLCTGSHNHRKESFDLITKSITLEEGSWVGACCFVGPGVTVGLGAVCAAGSVVVRDVSSKTVVGGNPAREISK